MRRVDRRAAMAMVALAATGAARGEPARGNVLRIVVTQAPGGAADALARGVGDAAARALGRSLLIDNRPGGGGVIGALAVAHAVPDGETIGLILSSHVINQALRRDLPYDALRDFAPLCLGGHYVMALVAHPELECDDIDDLLALARRSADPLHYASLGTGSASHLAGELLALRGGVPLQHVPYNGSAPVYHALRGRQVNLAFVTLDSARPHVEAGRLKVLGVTDARRSAVFPDMPAIAETLPGYEIVGFFGFVAPAGTPAPTVDALSTALTGALNAAPVRERLTAQAAVVATEGPAGFAAFLRRQVRQYEELAQRTGLRLG